MIKPEDPAFAQATTVIDEHGRVTMNHVDGMNIRTWLAGQCAAAHFFVNRKTTDYITSDGVANDAVVCADAIIEKLNKK